MLRWMCGLIKMNVICYTPLLGPILTWIFKEKHKPNLIMGALLPPVFLIRNKYKAKQIYKIILYN